MRTLSGRPFDHLALGRFGEKVARRWLVARGAKILYCNFRWSGGGEVDIVAREGKLLLFIEVKTRTAGGLGRPLEAVTSKKQDLIRRGGKAWLRLLKREDVPWRYDVIEVIVEEGKKPQVHRVENAFQ